jgi:tRNA(Ile)-lysidine synthase
VLRKFEKFIEEEGLCNRQDTILVACSGGLDSMTLLHLFRKSGYKVAVAHANFQLRGAESDRDEDFVRNYCATHRLEFFSKRFQTNNYAMVNGVSIQMAARELRYEWFDKLLEITGFALVATAHHLNDLAETIFINLVRGKGIEGIRPKNKRVIRPLLNWTRNELELLAGHEQVIWREDASNFSDDYDRNKIRHHVIPILKELNPSLEETLFQIAKKSALEDALLEHAFRKWEETFIRQNGGTFILKKEGVESEENLPLLFRWLRPYGFHYDQCVDMRMARNGQSGKRFFSASHELVVDRETLIMAPRPPLFEKMELQSTDLKVEQLGQRLVFEPDYRGSIEPDMDQAFLDADSISYPIIWRTWQEGDSFQPLGMDGTRKISDFLIDRKVPRLVKERTTVLESGGRIIWVVGHRIDHRHRVRPETHSVLRIRFK